MKKIFAIPLILLLTTAMTVNAEEVTGSTTKDLKKCLKGDAAECVLKNDITVSEDATDVNVNRDVTINLNGHTLTFANDNELWVKKNANLTIKNGTINQESDEYSAIVVIYGNVTTSNLTINANGKDSTAFWLEGKTVDEGASLTVSSDTKVNAPKGSGIGIPDGGLPITADLNGKWNTNDSIILGTEDTTTFTKAKITFNGGTYTTNGVTIPVYKRGTWIINDGTFISNNDNVISFNEPTNPKNLSFKINGGTFETKAMGKTTISSTTNLKKFVSGGTFIANKVVDELPEDYITTGYGSYVTEDGKTIVGIVSNIKIETSENGKVEAENTTAVAGQTITLTITPEENYELGSLIVKDERGNEINVENNQFIMPERNVTIIATFKEKTADYSALDELIKKAEEFEKETYTEESYKKLEEVLKEAKELSRELKINDQETIDNLVKKLEEAINGLEEIIPENPQTGDQIATCFSSVLLSISLIGLGIKSYKKD